jgi:hypothetical protein
MLLLAANPPSPRPVPSQVPVPVLDVFILCVTTYMAYTRFPLFWRTMLCHFYAFFVVTWAYAETYGRVGVEAGLKLRCLNAGLCVLNLVMEANEAWRQRVH